LGWIGSSAWPLRNRQIGLFVSAGVIVGTVPELNAMKSLRILAAV
jgi:hypothetical protein